MASIQQELPGFKRTLFYVYILWRPDGRPFYVGKGHGYRIGMHATEARSGHQCHKCNVIRKIWRDGGEFGKRKVFETHDEAEAFAMERYLIASIGREHLANVTDGGEGNYGWVPSAEWHAKVQAAKIGKPRSEACKAKIRAAFTGRKLPPEHVEAAAAGHRGQKRSEEAKRRISEAQKGKPRPQTTGERHPAAKLTVKQVLEIRRLRKQGVSLQKLARQFGVTKSGILGITMRRTWKHLPDE